MNRAVLVASLVVATSGTAKAGTYLGLGIGTAPAMTEDSGRIDSDGRSAKVLIGSRWGNVSLEGAIDGNALARSNDRGVISPFGDLYQATGALKLNLPLGNNFEAFGRAGVHHTWVNADNDALKAQGNGLLLGAGVEYRLNLGVGAGSIFVDYQFSKASLTGDNNDKLTYDLSTRMFMLGVTVGI